MEEVKKLIASERKEKIELAKGKKNMDAKTQNEIVEKTGIFA